MMINDKYLHVPVALALYSQYLNDNEPKLSTLEHDYWELARRQVWDLRNEIERDYRAEHDAKLTNCVTKPDK